MRVQVKSFCLLASAQATLLAFATQGFNEMVECTWGKVKAAWADLNGVAEPLPSYSAENEAAFIQEMLAGDRVSKLSASVDRLQASLQSYKEIAAVLGAVKDDAAKATSTAKVQLSKVCAVTCLRILTSKSAQMLSPALQQPVSAAMEFARSNELTLPTGIMDRMENLLNQISEASAPKKRRSAKQ